MKKFLLLTPLPEYQDDINLCNSFNSVMTFFLKKYLEKAGCDCKVIPTEDAFTIKHASKSNYHTFKRLIEDTGVLDEFTYVVILGIKSLRSCDPRILHILKNNVKGRLFELDETGKRSNSEFVCIYMIPADETDNTKFIGQGVDLDFLYPDKQPNILSIHVDHAWPARAEYFDRIREQLTELVESQIYKAYGFESVEILFHTVPVDDIALINNTVITPGIPFPQLAEIYRKVNVGFVSHAETMGNYPLEIAAAGGTVILPDSKSLPGAVKALVKFYTSDIDNFWHTVLSNLMQTQEQNILLAKNFSYEKVVNRLITITGDK